MGVFDGYTKTVFSTTLQVMGDTLIWNPSDNSPQVSETVLFNNPDIGQTLGDVDKYNFQTYNYWFEYLEGHFSGLKDSVDSGNIETVAVKGFTLDVQKIVTKFDGQNYVAFCVAHE